MVHRNRIWPVVLVLFAPAAACGAETVTVESLLREMTDRDRLARFPDPTYTTNQASSYDRRSVAADKPGWFANHDTSQYIRTETTNGRKENVLMDADGPGAVTRIWMASPRPGAPLDGVIRIYLDGDSRPTIQKSAEELLGGATALVGPPLAATRAGGRSFFLPIPYAQHCKITCDTPGNCTYNIEYRTYPPPAKVRSFSADQIVAARELLAATQKQLLSPVDAIGSNVTVSPPQKQRLEPAGAMELNLDGPGAIRELSVQLVANDLPQALRSTVIEIDFDGVPAVWCPVGDFFGSGVGLNPFHTWTRQVEKSGVMTCRWTMPYARATRVELRNLGVQPVDATLGPVSSIPWAWDAWSMHFHASWHQQFPIHTKARDGTMDWNAIEIKGTGVYVGDTLSIHNGARAFWGEGDEKIYVDGETFPSHFGTGTSDCYGISGGDRSGFFDSPFAAQPRWDGNAKPGFVTLTRDRSLDAIAFTKSLKFDWEIWHWAATDVEYTGTSYWYALPGATSNRSAEAVEAQRSVLFSP